MADELVSKKDLNQFEERIQDQFKKIDGQFKEMHGEVGSLRQSTAEKIDKLEMKTGENFLVVQQQLNELTQKVDSLTRIEWEVRTNHEKRLRKVEDELGVRPEVVLRV